MKFFGRNQSASITINDASDASPSVQSSVQFAYTTTTKPIGAVVMSISSVVADAVSSTSSASISSSASTHLFSRLEISNVPSIQMRRVLATDFDTFLRSISEPCNVFLSSPTRFSSAATAVASASAATVSAASVLGKTPPDAFGTIPPFFFDPEFTLDNPRYLDLVLSVAAASTISTSQASLVSSTPRNMFAPVSSSVLVGHLDTIEANLAKEIGARSDSFFLALENLNTLQQESKTCLLSISTLRATLAEVGRVHSLNALKTAKLTIRRASHQRLLDFFTVLHNLRVSLSSTTSFLSHNDISSALDAIVECSKLLTTLQHLSSAGIFTAARFSLTDDIIAHVPLAPPAPTAKREITHTKIYSSFLSKKLEGAKLLRSTLEVEFCRIMQGCVETGKHEDMFPVIAAMYRIDCFPRSLELYKEKLFLMSRLLFFKTINHDEKTQFSKALKGLSLDSFLSLLGSLYATTNDFCKSIIFSHSVFITVLKECEQKCGKFGGDKTFVPSDAVQKQVEPTSDFLDEDYGKRAKKDKPTLYSSAAHVASESGNLLKAVASYIYSRCARVLVIRADQNSQLSAKEFLRLYDLNLTFIDCTLFPGDEQPLRNTLLTQSKAFCTHFHMEQTKQITCLLENEQWVPADVLFDFQSIFDSIVAQSGMQLDSVPSASEMCLSASCEVTQEKVDKFLIINNKKFHVAFVVLILGKLVAEYLFCAQKLQNITVEVVQKLSELLKFFNLRMCQLVLGAGAVQSAGLKNINAKHLAISAQSLSSLIELLPFINKTFELLVNLGLPDFDKVMRDFEGHREEIYKKLGLMMGERMVGHCNDFSLVNWENSESPSPPIEAIIRETTLFHKVLARYLPSNVLVSMFRGIVQQQVTVLEQEVVRTKIHSQQGKDKILFDVLHFIEKISLLKGVEFPENNFKQLVVNLKIIESKPETKNITSKSDGDQTVQKTKQMASDWIRKIKNTM